MPSPHQSRYCCMSKYTTRWRRRRRMVQPSRSEHTRASALEHRIWSQAEKSMWHPIHKSGGNCRSRSYLQAICSFCVACMCYCLYSRFLLQRPSIFLLIRHTSSWSLKEWYSCCSRSSRARRRHKWARPKWTPYGSLVFCLPKYLGHWTSRDD